MKKMTALLLLTTFLCAALLGSSVFCAVLGDLNDDGELNNKDVVVLFRALSGGENTLDKDVADINGDGEINNKDVVALFRAVSGGEPLGEIVYAKSFSVSRAIGKDMVIQRNEPIRIWGWAPDTEEGKYVRAEFSGLSGRAKIKNGEWMITLDALPENTTPQDITIYGDGTETTIKNVLIGDVYWISGQSNIAYSVQNMNIEPLSPQEAKNVEVSNDMQIRLNRTWSADFSGKTLGTNEVSKDVLHKRGWQKPRIGASAFTALGYYTAVRLYNALDRKVPIGMIEFDGNGLALHAFLPNEVRDELKVSQADKNGVYSAPGVNPHQSSFIYNLGMYPFQNLPIAGFIWYQGESDCASSNNNCYAYAERFTAFIKYIRDKHDLVNHDYPVYIVELSPSFQYNSNGQANQYIDFATVRMNMGSIPTMLENAHICSTEDLWKDKEYNNNLHPYNKWELSERMTKLILANGLGIGDIAEGEGPIVDSFTVSADGKTAIVKFNNVGQGLVAQGGVLKGFKVATSTANYSYLYDPTTAKISGKDTVTLTYTKPIKKVAYNNALANTFPEVVTLCNSAGVPCAAFSINEK